jgi:hypothetical protein
MKHFLAGVLVTVSLLLMGFQNAEPNGKDRSDDNADAKR